MDKTTVDQPNNDDQKLKTEQDREDRKFVEGRIIIRKLSKAQREKLLSVGASGLAGMLGGAGAFSLMSFVSKEESVNPLPPDHVPDPIDPIDRVDSTPMPDPVIIYTESPFAQHTSDDMSFGEAFAAARVEVGPGGIFEWHGNTYGTYYKEEWDSLSDADKDEYWEGVANATSKIEEEPIPEPEPIPDPEDEVYTITEDDFIESADVDGDGLIDVALVDANSNDMPDLVLDTDGDGDMDVLVLDVDAETGEITGNEVIVELVDDGSYTLPDNVHDNHNSEHIANNDSRVDDYTDVDLNPDIDNNMDVDDYIE